MALRRFSPPAMFLGFGAVGLGAALVVSHPGSRALFIVDWGLLFLMAVPATGVLFLLERLLSRAHRRAEPDLYPSAGPVVLGLFGVAVALLALTNGQLRRSTRVVTPVVHGWFSEARAIPSMFGVPQSQSAGVRAKAYQAQVAVEAWWDQATELRLPVSAELMALAEGPGHHRVELVVADGALGIEFIEAVRVLPAP